MTANLRKVVTIGVYGFDEAMFFKSLKDAEVDTFCDVRLRRGMRGSAYSFANSKHLQDRLTAMGIHYVHAKNLAPTKEIRELQHSEDAMTHTLKRSRTVLGSQAKCLSTFNMADFERLVGYDAKVVALFCVEREPDACHRSLVAARLSSDLGVEVHHIQP